MMRRLIAALQTTVLLAGFLVLAVPADLACCAGVAEVHGPSCCESAYMDAVAESCCAGDQVPPARLAEPQLSPPPLVSVTLPPAPVLHSVARLPQLGRTADSFPPDGGLFTLHAAFLI